MHGQLVELATTSQAHSGVLARDEAALFWVRE